MINTLKVSEWQLPEVLLKLLEPFTIHTDVFQPDTCLISYIIPALIDLKLDWKQLAMDGMEPAEMMLADFSSRF